MRKLELGGALLLECEGELLLVDCPEGTARALGGREVRGVLILGDGPERVAGLYGLLVAEGARGREAPLALVHGLDDRRPEAIAGAFLQTEDNPFDLEFEADGGPIEVGPFTLVHHGGRWRVEAGGEREWLQTPAGDFS